MTSRVTDWLGFHGTTSRETYAVLGCILAAVKYNLDRFVANYFFDQSWSPIRYGYIASDHTLFEVPASHQTFSRLMRPPSRRR